MVGMFDAADRFPGDPDGNEEQSEAVDEGGKHLESRIAIGPFHVGRTVGDQESDEGQDQRHGVGQHVAGIGDQGKRSRQIAADGFHHHESDGQEQRPQHPLLVGRIAVIVAVAHQILSVTPAKRSLLEGLARIGSPKVFLGNPALDILDLGPAPVSIALI